MTCQLARPVTVPLPEVPCARPTTFPDTGVARARRWRAGPQGRHSQRRRCSVSRHRPAQRAQERRELHARLPARGVRLRPPQGSRGLLDRQRAHPPARDVRGARRRGPCLGGRGRRGDRSGPRPSSGGQAAAPPRARARVDSDERALRRQRRGARVARRFSGHSRTRDLACRDRRTRKGRCGPGGRGRVVRARRAVHVLLGAVSALVTDRRSLRQPWPVRAAVPDGLRVGRRLRGGPLHPGSTSALAQGSRRHRPDPRVGRVRRRGAQDRGADEEPGVRRARDWCLPLRPGPLRRRPRGVRRARRRAGGALGGVLSRVHRGLPRRRARQRDDELRAAQQPRRTLGARGHPS